MWRLTVLKETYWLIASASRQQTDKNRCAPTVWTSGEQWWVGVSLQVREQIIIILKRCKVYDDRVRMQLPQTGSLPLPHITVNLEHGCHLSNQRD